jgi:hypothetical protein
VREGVLLRGWWVREMLTHALAAHRAHDALLAQPLRVGAAEGALTRLMLAQNRTLRANALGNFGTLLHTIARTRR